MPDANEERALLALLKAVALVGKTTIALEGDGIRLASADAEQARSPVPRTVLKRALSQGLLSLQGQTLCTTPEAAAFLRRQRLTAEDGFQDQHRDIAELRHGGQVYRSNRAESVLGCMARLKEKSGAPFLPGEAIAAGERLHRDFTRARLQPRLTMVYAPRLATTPMGIGRNAAEDLSDTALAARERVARAMEAVGPELCGVALDVCCFEKGLETVERERQWPVRSAKLMLRAALMALARHYQPPPVGKTAHQWGAEGYRPELRDAVVTGLRDG